MSPSSLDVASEDTNTLLATLFGELKEGLKANDQVADWREVVGNVFGQASRAATDMSVEQWEASHTPCSAEQWAQWFTELVWEAMKPGDDAPFPYRFATSVDQGPMAQEFLDRLKTTEEGVREVEREVREEEQRKSQIEAQSQAEAQRKLSEKANIKKEEAEEFEFPVNNKHCPPAPKLQTPVKQESVRTPVNLPFRPETGDTNCKAPPTQQATGGQPGRWNHRSRPKRPYQRVRELSDLDKKLMNVTLMNRVWRERVEPRITPSPATAPWEVRILMEKANLLDYDKNRLFSLLGQSAVRIHAHEADDFLHIGMWVRTAQSQGMSELAAIQQMMLYYSILMNWAAEVSQDSRPRTLAQFLSDWYDDRINQLLPKVAQDEPEKQAKDKSAKVVQAGADREPVQKVKGEFDDADTPPPGKESDAAGRITDRAQVKFELEVVNESAKKLGHKRKGGDLADPSDERRKRNRHKSERDKAAVAEEEAEKAAALAALAAAKQKIKDHVQWLLQQFKSDSDRRARMRGFALTWVNKAMSEDEVVKELVVQYKAVARVLSPNNFEKEAKSAEQLLVEYEEDKLKRKARQEEMKKEEDW